MPRTTHTCCPQAGSETSLLDSDGDIEVRLWSRLEHLSFQRPEERVFDEEDDAHNTITNAGAWCLSPRENVSSDLDLFGLVAWPLPVTGRDPDGQ